MRKILATLMCLVTLHNDGKPVYYNLDNVVAIRDVSGQWDVGKCKTSINFLRTQYAIDCCVDESVMDVIKATKDCK